MKTALVILSLVLSAGRESLGEVDGFIFGSLGEGPYRQISDVVGSTLVPQAGLQAAWSMKYGGPFIETSVGRYYAGALYEGWLGLQAGVDIWKVRPSLKLGLGIQSANRREYEFESDEYDLVRGTYFPFGLGMRMDLFDRAFVELDSRSRGSVMWRFALGWRVSRLGWR